MRSDGIFLVYSIICTIFLLFCGILITFKKTELLMGLTQTITLKVAFREEYVTEHRSVIACWNQNEKIYRMSF